jgi:hypothetical protein
METNETPKWKYFIPFYGIYATYKSETPGKGKWWVVSILITLIFVSLFNDKKKERTESASSSTSSTEATSSSDTSSESQKKPVDLPKVGQMVKTDSFEITLTKFLEKSSVGSEYLNQKASEGATFVAVEFKYKNVSGKPISSYKLPNKLKLIDRKKNIFKLSQGEYIAPEKLESIYKRAHSSFEDVFIYGDSK